MNGFSPGNIKKFQLFKGLANEDMSFDNFSLSNRDFININDISFCIHIDGLSTHLNAREIHAEFIIKSMTQKWNQLINEATTVLFIIDKRNYRTSNFKRNRTRH